MKDETQAFLAENSIQPKSQWAIQFEDGSLFGEQDGDDFMLYLYPTKLRAYRGMVGALDNLDLFFRAVEISVSVAGHE